MIKKMTTHALERTNPFGERFIGRCRLCGKEGLTSGAALEPCDNPRGLNQAEALIEAIEGDDEQATANKH